MSLSFWVEPLNQVDTVVHIRLDAVHVNHGVVYPPDVWPFHIHWRMPNRIARRTQDAPRRIHESTGHVPPWPG